ncbi:MAG: TonB-dependent receptor [Ignavibacteriaceae bacterium]
MDFRINFVLIFFLLTSFTILKAQDFTVEKTDTAGLYRLSEVVISATKTATPTLEVASSISVIDSAEIAERNSFNVADLLRDQYGVYIAQQGSPGALESIFLRGGNSNHTLVLIDGIEMNMPNDPSNTFDFSDLSIDNIQRIEILRGPQSILYGSDALAGVINIVTRRGYGKPKAFLSFEGGSYGTLKGLGGLNGSINLLNYSLTLSKYKTTGFSAASKKYGNSEKDGTDNDNVSSRLGFNFSKNFNLNFFYRYNKAKTDYDQHGGIFGDDPTYIYKLDESAFRTEGNLSFLNGLLTQKAGFSYFRNVRKYSFDSTLNNPFASNSFYDGRKIKFDLQNNLNLSENYKFILGLETEQEKVYTEYYSFTSSYFYGNILPFSSLRTSAVYLENQSKLLNSLFSSIGIRLDHHQKFGDKITYRIAPAYIIWQTATKLKATLGTGFKTPSLTFLFDPAYGNPDLKPEQSIGWDAGFEQFINNYLSFGITYFNNSYKDLFGYDANYREININKALTNGVEIFADIYPFKDLKLKVNYTYTNAVDKSENSADKNKPLLRRPKHKFDLNINYNFSDKINTNIDLIYVGKRDDKIFTGFTSERTELSPYLVINLAVSYKVFDFVNLNLRIENLLNKYYEEVYGYATPGLSAYAGVKFLF